MSGSLPQSLFAPNGEDAPGHRSFLRRARQERERGNDESSQLALGAFLVASLVDRFQRQNGESSEADGFRWQLRSTLHFVRELPADAAEAAHLQAIVESLEQEGPQQLAVIRMGLIAYGYFLNQEGRYEDSLDILKVASTTGAGAWPPGETASFALFLGGVRRRLALWNEAVEAYQAAESTAREIGDRRTELQARLGLSNLLRQTGNLPRSMELARQVLAEADDPDLIDVQSRAYSVISAGYDKQGRRIESVVMQYRAFQTSMDDTSKWHNLANLGSALAALGQFQAARDALQTVVARSDVFGSRMNAVIELIGVTSATGDQLGFHRLTRMAQDRIGDMPPSMLVDYHYQCGIGHARLGKVDTARRMLERGRALAEEHGLNEWYFRVDQVLRHLGPCRDVEEAGDWFEHGQLEEVTEGLRHLALTAPAQKEWPTMDDR